MTRLLLITCLLSSCEVSSGNSRTGDWRTASLGRDATNYRITSEGMSADSINESITASKVADTIKGMWTNYLTAEGLKFLAGKYYDAKGAELASSETVELTKLQNAATVDEASAQLEVLKLTEIPQ